MKMDTSDLLHFVGFLDRLKNGVHANRKRAVMAAGNAYEGDVKKCPLTPVDTGQYRTSMRTDDVGNMITGPIAAIGSPMPQTRRLEFGYVGVDAMGRFYNQRPRPHWRPTWDFGKARYDLILSTELLWGVKMTK